MFIPVHLIMIGWWGWPELNALKIFGHQQDLDFALGASLAIIAAIVAIHVAATVWSLRAPRQVQKVLGAIVSSVRFAVLRPAGSRQDYPHSSISPEHRVNGKPPCSAAYQIMAVHNFVDWRLEVGGLVERPMSFSLDDLRELGSRQTQRVLHNCVQGWSSIGEWSGVPLRTIIELVRPLPEARQLCFLTMQDNSRDESSAEGAGQFYEIIDIGLAEKPQALLAYDMNGDPLPIKHGAPLRLRVETQVGFKMAKWIDRIEVVSDYRGIGKGMGGWREDNVYHDKVVGSMTALRVRTSALPRRPELEWFDEAAKQRVLRIVRVRGMRCSGCGRRSFFVGDALYLGFLVENAEQDEYMVGLVCRNRACPAPRTGIRLQAADFLRSGRG